TLHKLWDDHYERLSKHVDEIAERVRYLDGFPIGTAAGFLEHATIEEHPGKIATATEAVEALVEDHEHVIRLVRSFVTGLIEEQSADLGRIDFLTQLLRSHEEMSWTLRSFLLGEPVQPFEPLEEAHGPELA